MDMHALPSQLLDDQELQERYKSIDTAAIKVRVEIERKIKAKGYEPVPAKLSDRALMAGNA